MNTAPRTTRALVAGTAVVITSTVLGGASAARATTPVAAESHVTGDAWLRYPGDLEYPYRRFTVDAHGRPWKIVNHRIVMGDAHGTVRFDHYAPDQPGGPSMHHWGSIKVDYLMTGGPVAVVSGIRQDDVPANMKRATLSFYSSPLGHRHDRMGFSWGVVEARCQQMGSGPAPFNPASAGPDGRWLRGYTVKDAPLPIPADGDFEGPPDPADCTFAGE
jgi:hypothetical protein